MIGFRMAAVLLVLGCGSDKDDDTSVTTTEEITTGGGGGPGGGGTASETGHVFVDTVWGMSEPCPGGIAHTLVFDVPISDPYNITVEPVYEGGAPINAGALSGEVVATFLFDQIPTGPATYTILAFIDEDNTGGVDLPMPDEGDFVASEGGGLLSYAQLTDEERVTFTLDTQVP